LAEAVSNAVRHGRASEIIASITKSAEQLQLRIQDNGTGFTAIARDQARPLSLRSRVEELGGRLLISPCTQGADLRIEIPA
jgi:signal transduction histidine kinase